MSGIRFEDDQMEDSARVRGNNCASPETLVGCGTNEENRLILRRFIGIFARQDAVYHKILEDCQNSNILCSVLVILVLRKAMVGFQQPCAPSVMKRPVNTSWMADCHT